MALRARKVSRAFEKRAPGPDFQTRLSASPRLKNFTMIRLSSNSNQSQRTNTIQ